MLGCALDVAELGGTILSCDVFLSLGTSSERFFLLGGGTSSTDFFLHVL